MHAVHAVHTLDRTAVSAVQATSVFAWSVLGRSLVLLLFQSAFLLATVLLLESYAVDGDPWQRLLSAVGRHVSGLVTRIRCAGLGFGGVRFRSGSLARAGML